VEALPWETNVRFLFRDGDGIFGDAFQSRIEGVLATRLVRQLIPDSVQLRVPLRGPLVVVVKPAEYRQRFYARARHTGGAIPRGNLLADPLVRSRLIEVGRVVRQRSLKMLGAQYQGVIETLAPDASEKPFAKRIGFGGVVGRSDHFDCDVVGDVVELGPELRVVVANQKPRGRPDRRCVAQLLSDPILRGRSSHAHLDDFT
jgi:hypothetical protein